MKPSPSVLYAAIWMSDFVLVLLIFTTSRALAEHDASQAAMGLIGGGHGLALGLSSLLSGRLSDKTGRHRLMSTGATTLLISTLVCGASHGTSSIFYYLSYWLSAAAAGMIYPPVYAWLSEGASAHVKTRSIGRTIILFCVAWNAGVICGQTVGGWLFRIDEAWPIGLAIALSAAMLLLLALARRPARQTAWADSIPDSAPEPPPAPNPLAAAFAKLAWLSNLGSAFSMAIIMHLLPKLAVLLDVPPDAHGLMLAATRGTVITMYFVLFFSTFWHMRLSTALASQVLAILGLVTVALAGNALWLLLGLICTAQLTGHNYFASLYYSTAGSADANRGLASGLHEATMAMGFAAGALTGGLIGQHYGVRAPYLLAAVIIAASALTQTIIYGRRIRPLLSGWTAEIPARKIART